MFGHNTGGDRHLYDRRGDPEEARNLAPARPAEARDLFAFVRRQAGGPLPDYPKF
jgi:hypothetical protein